MEKREKKPHGRATGASRIPSQLFCRRAFAREGSNPSFLGFSGSAFVVDGGRCTAEKRRPRFPEPVRAVYGLLKTCQGKSAKYGGRGIERVYLQGSGCAGSPRRMLSVRTGRAHQAGGSPPLARALAGLTALVSLRDLGNSLTRRFGEPRGTASLRSRENTGELDRVIRLHAVAVCCHPVPQRQRPHLTTFAFPWEVHPACEIHSILWIAARS